MALAYSQFGVTDRRLYAAYLATFYDGAGSSILASSEGVSASALGRNCTAGDSGRLRRSALGYLEQVCRGGASGDNGGKWGTSVGGAHAAGRRDSGVFKRAGGWRVAVEDSCSVAGVVSGAECGVGDVDGAVGGSDGAIGMSEDAAGCDAMSEESLKEEKKKKGKNYEKNRAKRERAKGLKASVSGLREVCPSLTGSVCTVDTRTAEEIEAVRTLAARRVAENKVAEKMAELKLISLNNKDKTDAVLRLEAARMEQRINEAKAKSQASFKECDTSLKSLGSTGSAGEFALKQEVKRGRDNEIRLKYAQLQNDYMIKHVPEHVRQVILDMPEPVFEHDAEVFGECPEDYDDEQRMAYDIEMNSRAAGVQY